MTSKNWIIEKNTAKNRWYLEIGPDLPLENYPTVDSIKEKTSALGIESRILISDERLERNLEKARAIPGEEFSFPLVIEPTFDVRLNINADKTRATLYIRKASTPDNQLDLKLVSAAINNSRVKGMDPERIKKDIIAFRDSPEMELQELLLAEGVPPGRGSNRKLVPALKWLDDAEALPLRDCILSSSGDARRSDTRRSDGRQDSASFTPTTASRFSLVEQGQILFEFSPSEPGEPGTDVFGKEIPGLPGNDPTIELKDNITLCPEGLRADCSGLLYAGSDDNRVQVGIIPFKDASATVVITPDNMTVSIILEREEGPGHPLTLELATQSLKEKEVKGAINTNLIKEAIDRVLETGENAEVIVLRGEAPVLPGSIKITRLIHPKSEDEPVLVYAGDRILSLRKLPEGQNGHDVFGNILISTSAQPVEDPEYDETIARETVGGETFFTARVSGEVRVTGNRYSVANTKSITCDIDEKTGDIIFPGNLELVGNIASGRSVKAGEKLKITGSAAASLAYAEDSVHMNGGIKGAGRGTVWAKREIHITWAENARILAGQAIRIDKFCFQCTVKTNEQLLMKGIPGVLLGGSIRATRGIEVMELGSAKTIRTSISFGQNYLVSDKIEVSERELEQIRVTVEKLDAERERTPPTNPRIHELRRKKLELLKRKEKLTVRVFTLKEQFETHYISHIRVENTVYPGVILESHGRYHEVREPKHHVVFIFDQTTGQIVCSPIPDHNPILE